jgi:hypothetical protein
MRGPTGIFWANITAFSLADVMLFSADGAARLGWVALSLCTAAHPFHARFSNIFGASVSETTMRPLF